MLIPFIHFFFPDWYSLNYFLFVIGVAALALNFVIDNARKKYSKTGALIQQKFDNDLFDLKLDVNVREEDISKLERKYKKDVEKLRGWYSSMITPDVNTNSAILLCQRSNLFWTTGLRKKVIRLFFLVGIIYYIIILTLGSVFGLSLIEFLLSFVAPSFPMIIFIAKSYNRQTAIVNLCEIQLEKVNQIYKQYIDHAILPDQDDLIAIQEKIFEIRKKPEVLPYELYKRTRDFYENIVDETAGIYMKEILKKQTLINK